jgi:general secretion pathway protein N
MKRAVWITLLAILAFAIILVARMPVRWVAGFLPKNISCAELSGTVWNGTCSGLVAQNLQVGNVSWDLRAAALLKRRIAGHIELTRGQNFARGDIEATTSGSVVSARDFQADMPLDPTLIPQLPRNLTGVVRVNLQSIHIENGAITSAQGLVEAHDLVQGSGGQRLALGDFSLTFPAADPAAEPVGQLRSLSGPLNVEGTLRLTREPGFVLEGLVAPTPEASPQLVKEIGYLGAPDAQGRRPFSVAATF